MLFWLRIDTIDLNFLFPLRKFIAEFTVATKKLHTTLQILLTTRNKISSLNWNFQVIHIVFLDIDFLVLDAKEKKSNSLSCLGELL